MDTPLEPLLLEFPEVIETTRLRLQVPGPSDGGRICSAVQMSLEQLKPWMPWAKDDYSERDAEIWCRRARGEFHLRKQVQYMIVESRIGEHIGNVGTFKFNWEVRSGEIGYWLRSDRTGQGLMTEAVLAIRDDLVRRLGFRRIEIRCDDGNLASGRVAERAGFALEGVFRSESLTVQGQPRDTRIYAHVPASR